MNRILSRVCVIVGLLSQTVLSQDCSSWKYNEVANAPQWTQSKPQGESKRAIERQVGTLTYSVVELSNQRQLLVRHDDCPDTSSAKSEEEMSYWNCEKLLLVVGADTLFLDRSRFGFAVPSVNGDETYAVVRNPRIVADEVDRGDIIVIDLTSGDVATVFALSGDSPIVFNPMGNRFCFADYADLYICDAEHLVCERVVNGGGSYWLGDCISWDTIVTDILWSADGSTLYFEYRSGASPRVTHRIEIKEQ